MMDETIKLMNDFTNNGENKLWYQEKFMTLPKNIQTMLNELSNEAKSNPNLDDNQAGKIIYTLGNAAGLEGFVNTCIIKFDNYDTTKLREIYSRLLSNY